MKRIKVLYLIDTLAIGGAEKSLADIAVNNPKVESIFITIYTGDGLVSLLNQNSIEVHQLNNSFRYEFKTVVTQLLPLLDIIKPDIIHSTLFRSDIIARKVKKYRNFPLISSFVNNTYLSERYRNLSLLGKVKLYGCQLMDKWSANKVDLFISNSATIMETNSRALGIKKEKVKVIYRGRSSKNFDSIFDEEANTLRLKLNINSVTIVLLNVSRLVDRKGQLDLLESYAEVVKKHPNTMLLFAGEGAFRATLEKAIDDFQLKEKVVLLGNVDYIPLLLKMSDIFIFPSHYEGLPGALLEAMLVQKIIICSDIGENKECVSDTEAVFFKTHDIEDLTLKINMVLNNLTEYEPMAINAKKAALSKFELSNVIDQYNEAYQNLLEN